MVQDRSRERCAGSSRCIPELAGTDARGAVSRGLRDQRGRSRSRCRPSRPRAGQVEMAAAVVARVRSTAACCSQKRAPAPGRRSAYLVPAILSRERVLISTGTKNLQEQICLQGTFRAARRPQGDGSPPFHGDVHEGARASYLCVHASWSSNISTLGTSALQRARVSRNDDPTLRTAIKAIPSAKLVKQASFRASTFLRPLRASPNR